MRTSRAVFQPNTAEEKRLWAVGGGRHVMEQSNTGVREWRRSNPPPAPFTSRELYTLSVMQGKCQLDRRRRVSREKKRAVKHRDTALGSEAAGTSCGKTKPSKRARLLEERNRLFTKIGSLERNVDMLLIQVRKLEHDNHAYNRMIKTYKSTPAPNRLVDPDVAGMRERLAYLEVSHRASDLPLVSGVPDDLASILVFDERMPRLDWLL